MSKVIENLERQQLRKGIPDVQPGDGVKVHFQVVEGTRRRTQVFEGTVIKRQGSGVRETFTVRKQSFGVGVERTFPLHSPKIEQIEVASRGDVRRAKLYYLRDRVGRGARGRERRCTGAADEQAYVEGAMPADDAPRPGDDELDEVAAAEEAAAAEAAEGEAPAAEEPVAAEPPSAEEASAEQPSAEEPSAEEPSAPDAPADEAAADEPAPDEVPAGEPAPDEPDQQ